eukprot:scaffold17157_cov53-Attheya_sp.AAC.8
MRRVGSGVASAILHRTRISALRQQHPHSFIGSCVGYNLNRSKNGVLDPGTKALFHSTRWVAEEDVPAPTTTSRVRRRRNRTTGRVAEVGGGDEPTNDRNHPKIGPPTSVMDGVVFEEAAEALLHHVEQALAPMKRSNDVFDIYRSTSSENDVGPRLVLRLAPSEGQYMIQIHPQERTMTLTSPMSGTYTYVLSVSDDTAKGLEWVGLDDGHKFEGMLVRDLIRHCNGLPSF